jgi:hypothetical protein
MRGLSLSVNLLRPRHFLKGHTVNFVRNALIIIALSVVILSGCLHDAEILSLKQQTSVMRAELDGMRRSSEAELDKYMNTTAVLKVSLGGFGYAPSGPHTSGSGVFVAPNMLLTAKHVVERRISDTSITVISIDGLEYKSIEVIEDVDDDMALVVIEGVWAGGQLGLGERPRLGDDVICVGSPVSYLNRQWHMTWARVASEQHQKHAFAYDGFCWHGCSGGPVIKDGELVGIIVQRHAGGNAMGYAIYIDRLDPEIYDKFR